MRKTPLLNLLRSTCAIRGQFKQVFRVHFGYNITKKGHIRMFLSDYTFTQDKRLQNDPPGGDLMVEACFYFSEERTDTTSDTNDHLLGVY